MHFVQTDLVNWTLVTDFADIELPEIGIARFDAELQALEKDIRDRITNWNQDPKPFAWTKTPMKSLNDSPHIYTEFLAQDTSSLARGPEAAVLRSHGQGEWIIRSGRLGRQRSQRASEHDESTNVDDYRRQLAVR